MNVILVKIFATALALSQVTTRPDAVRTQFDPTKDQAEVVTLLQAGCAHIRKAFDIEDIKLDDLIATAMDDPQAMSESIKALHGLKFEDLLSAYKQFCKNEKVENSAVDIGEVITYYDKAAADLPDPGRLKGLMLVGVSTVLDRRGKRFADIGEPDHRRIWVPLAEIPDHVQKAFIAAEDKRFFQHHGVDERGLIRAFVGNLAGSGRPQGGSTITQQVVKNLLVGDDVTYDRKIREIIDASRLEQTLSKKDILALYLNLIYLGRGSYGVEMAARNYFGKSVKDLSVAQGALLAGLTKGPNYFNPDRHPDRARERFGYVLDRMQEDGLVAAPEVKQARDGMPQLVAYDPPRRDSGFYFIDQVSREAKAAAGIDALGAASYTIHSTIQPDLQRATETALQEGLARYEQKTGRARFTGPEANVGEAIKQILAGRAVAPTDATGTGLEAAAQALMAKMPAWQQALENFRPALYDVHWPTAVIISMPKANGGVIKIGLRDGRIIPLSVSSGAIRRTLNLYDVVFVEIAERKNKASATAELRVRPSVQGAALVLENKTGRILAMAGGFSYPLSQLNRTSQTRRQPGSAVKPLTYLAALEGGLQPNTLVLDEPITLPPIGNAANARQRDYWSPKDYDGRSAGALTLRRGLEHSKNLVTAHLLDGGIAPTPEDSLERVCELAMEAQLYADCQRYYPFVLGAQPVRMLDLAAFYAAIANEGGRPAPYAIDEIEQNGLVVYRHEPAMPVAIGMSDPAAFYQLKSMLQGVVERGTARQLHALAAYVAGKTGTTEDENDAWFVGFTNDVTVAVWVGYDNADGQRHTLGQGQTGGEVAVPIFRSIIDAAWSDYAPRTALAPPSPEARQQLADLPIDYFSGERLPRSVRGGFIEHFRLNAQGQLADTQYRLVSREDALVYREQDEETLDDAAQGAGRNPSDRVYGDGTPYGRSWRTPPPQQPPQSLFGGLFGWFGDEQQRPRSRRVDPDYPSGGRGGIN
jgi:membrane carboxypeptidase/penicillin-binding protein